MLTSIPGTYENGQIRLEEPPPTDKPMRVIVTFTEEVGAETPVHPPKRQAGVLSGKIWMADDFDAPLDDLKEYM